MFSRVLSSGLLTVEELPDRIHPCPILFKGKNLIALKKKKKTNYWARLMHLTAWGPGEAPVLAANPHNSLQGP